ncbi:hypothetical protein GCM10027591_09150 [Zhihengliuella somnathii]
MSSAAGPAPGPTAIRSAAAVGGHRALDEPAAGLWIADDTDVLPLGIPGLRTGLRPTTAFSLRHLDY